MNIQALSATYFDKPEMSEVMTMGVAYHEAKSSIDEITAACQDLNRIGFRDFKFSHVSLTSPIDTVARSVFEDKARGDDTRKLLKMDRDLTYMVDIHFEFMGTPLKTVANVRVPYVAPGGKIVMGGKTSWTKSILVDRGVNLAKGGIYIPIDGPSFNMDRSTHSYRVNNTLEADNVIIGNPHNGKANKQGKGSDKISETQNIFLYLLAKYGWTETCKRMGVELELVTADSYKDAVDEYFPKGYMVFGSSGIKPTSGLPKDQWEEPKIFILHRGDIPRTDPKYTAVATVVANFYYIADKTQQYLSLDIMDDTDFWCNILGRFIFYRVGANGSWYTDAGYNHIINSMDKLLDNRSRRRLNMDGIECDDMYDIITWVITNEREIFANIRYSDISRKRLTVIRYLLRYIVDEINHLGYKLLGRVGDTPGVFENKVTEDNLIKWIRDHLREGTISRLRRTEHGEVESMESPCSNMIICNTSSMKDQTKAKTTVRDRNAIYEPQNRFHPSKFSKARIDGISAADPGGATCANMMIGPDLANPEWIDDVVVKMFETLRAE